MSTKLTLAALFTAAVAMTSCSGGSGGDINPDYFPVQLSNDGDWGMIDREGNSVFTDEFKNAPTVAVNGFFSVEEKNGTTLYKVSKKPQPVKDATELEYVGIYNDGVIPVVKKSSRITLIDGDGNTVLTLMPIDGKEITSSSNIVKEGLFVVQNEEGNYGAVNKKGETVVPFKYTTLNDFNEGLAVAYKYVNDSDNDGSKKYIIDTKGNVVAEIPEDVMLLSFEYKYGYLTAMDKDGRCGFYDKKGEFFRLSGKVKGISYYDKNAIVFQNENYESGLMKFDLKDEEILIKPRYSSIQILGDNRYLAVTDKKKYIVNNNDDRLVEFDSDYSWIYPVADAKFKFIASEGSHYVLLDGEGKLMNKTDYNNISWGISGEFLYSAFFSAESFVNSLLTNVTDKGIGNYYIGETARELGAEANRSWARRDFYDEELNQWSPKASITFSGRTTQNMAYGNSHYVFGRGWVNEAFINNNAVVDELQLSCETGENYWDQVKSVLGQALTAKGYKVTDQADNSITASNGKVVVTVTARNSGMVLVMTPASTLPTTEPDSDMDIDDLD